jgi:RNA polymerase sigma factor (sigma-70 family)
VGIREDESAASPEKTYRGDIDELIAVCADPIIKKVLLQRLNIYFNSRGRGLNQPEAEDLYQTVILKLIACLVANGGAQVTEDIYKISNYVATIAHNVCNDFLRVKYPERNRLKNKIRDLMRRHPDFSCWIVADHTLCGLTEWAGRSESLKAEKLFDELQEKDEGGVDQLNLAELIRLPLSKLVVELFSRCEGPIEIDRLVHLIANLHGVKDQLNESIDIDSLAVLQIADSSAGYHEDLEAKELLLGLWKACGELPLNQRKAFILTTSDYTGESLLHSVLREQVVTITQIYRSLGVTREGLISIWDKLPLSAAAAAAELGTSIQMIAKWRHRALRKLAVEFCIRK